MSKTNWKKLAVVQALQYIETRALNPEEFLKLIENLFNYYNQKEQDVISKQSNRIG